MWLAIETSGEPGSVALGTAGRTLAEIVTAFRARQSESLLPAIESLLARGGISAEQLEGVIVGAGPGSYTGLRIGAAAAKGLVHALGVPLHAFPSSAAVAVALPRAGRPVCVVTPLRRGEAAVTCYARTDAPPERLLGPEPMRVDDVVERTSSLNAMYAVPEGSDARAQLASAGVELFTAEQSVPRASALLMLAGAASRAGRIEAWQEWEPDYVGGWGVRS